MLTLVPVRPAEMPISDIEAVLDKLSLIVNNAMKRNQKSGAYVAVATTKPGGRLAERSFGTPAAWSRNFKDSADHREALAIRTGASSRNAVKFCHQLTADEKKERPGAVVFGEYVITAVGFGDWDDLIVEYIATELHIS